MTPITAPVDSDLLERFRAAIADLGLVSTDACYFASGRLES